MRKIQEHENKLKDNRRSEDEMELSEDERRKSEAEKIVIQTAMKSDQFGALIHHLSLVRNKRCLMAYVYNRAEVIRSLGWVVDCVLPEEIEEKLSSSEKEYFKNHAATLQSYMSELDLDLSVDMIPPKDPYIKVRVLEDIGEVVLSDQVANLARHAMLFLRRTDAEQYISQGLMEELTG
ncbi:DNA replication complex GINS protein PSF1-like isoform X4 [Olea europaea var. sylvestris]|nr:DNA replication complex GINS protein PSF1-like isoform X4 [Olea europaea var. sylvestris]CAA2965771.1 DNA replication complex GINS PSF1 [Olea europaea subsp. europaea]